MVMPKCEAPSVRKRRLGGYRCGDWRGKGRSVRENYTSDRHFQRLAEVDCDQPSPLIGALCSSWKDGAVGDVHSGGPLSSGWIAACQQRDQSVALSERRL